MRVANVQALGRSVIAAAAGLALLVGAMGAPASADQGFRQWVASFRSVAAKSGISGSTYDRAFRGVTEPDPEVIEKARFQPEFTAPVWDYFDNRVHENSVAVGRQMARSTSRGSTASRAVTASTATSCSPSGRWNRTMARS